MLFNERLRSLRIARNQNQKEFADLLGISPVTLSHYENGKREPDLDRLANLCKTLSVSSDYLLGLSNIINAQTEDTSQKLPIDRTLTMDRPRTPLDTLLPPYLNNALDFIEYQRQKQTADLAESKSEA